MCGPIFGSQWLVVEHCEFSDALVSEALDCSNGQFGEGREGVLAPLRQRLERRKLILLVPRP